MDKPDLLLEYLKEQYTQARQHETLRASTTTFLTAASGVILGFGFKDGEFHPGLWIGILVALIGAANFLINEAHFKGNRLHTSIAGNTRHAIENLIDGWANDKPTELRRDALEKHGLRGRDISVGQIVHDKIQWIPKGIIIVGILLVVISVVQQPLFRGKPNQPALNKTQQK